MNDEYTEYQDGEGKKAYLQTKQSANNAARNMATLAPNGGVGAEQYNNAMGEETEEVELEATPEEQMEQLELAIDETLTALNEKVSIIEDAILDASQELIEERVDEATEVLTEQIDNYLTYVAEEWLNENRLQVEQGFRTEIAENFMKGLKELFDNSFVDVPEDKHDIVDDLFAANTELEEQVNKTLAENLDLRNQLVAHECATAFVELTSDLADTEVEKLQKLAEGIEFNDVEQYTEKLNLLKESYFGQNKTEASATQLTEEFTTTKKPVADSEMSAYVSAISKLNKK